MSLATLAKVATLTKATKLVTHENIANIGQPREADETCEDRPRPRAQPRSISG